MTPAANLPPVTNFATSSVGVVYSGGKQWEQYQIADNLK
jgi:hypothetical protein